MSLCPKCGKPVYFAERKCSLGKEWHRGCLRCEECGKVLNPGQHAERKGTPYCHIPCYSALFGPTMFGHGSAVEAHTNFGKQADEKYKNSPMKKPDLLPRIKVYNDFYEGKTLQVKTKEVNGRLVLEAPLRIHWGVRNPIQLQQKDDTILPKEWRRSYCMAMENGLDADLLQKMDHGGDTKLGRTNSLEDLLTLVERSDKTEMKQGGDKYNTVTVRGEGSRRRKNREKRLSIINGHLYNVETSVFTPPYGTVTNVTITSLDPAPEVIKSLLEKFKVENNPDDFCLCTVKSNGELRTLRDSDYPLLDRVMMGPLEDEGKIFILEKERARDVSQEVAQYITLPEPMLYGFLEKYKKEEEEAITNVREKYKVYRQIIKDRLAEGALVTKL